MMTNLYSDNNKILFLGRKNDKYSEQIYNFIKKNVRNTKVIWSKYPKEKKKHRYFYKKYDFIISFRSYYILNKKILDNAKKAAINFHPSIPKYRGFGCLNYAIYNNEKYYGCTAHLMSKKIDNGQILDVIKFKISPYQTLSDILEKTYKKQVLQVKKIVKSIIINNRSLEKFINNSKKERWGKKIGNKAKLDKFYQIKLEHPEEKILRKLKATLLKKGNFSPYILYGRKKYFIKQ